MAGNDNVVQIIIKALDNTKAGLNTSITGMESLTGALGKMNTFFKIGEAAAAFFFERLISHSIETAASMEILHQKTGISVESLSTLAYAARQTDTDMEGLALGLKKMSSAMFLAQNGNEKAEATFKTLGISVTNADGTMKTQEQVLLEVAGAFSKLQDGAGKSALAVQLFGKSGTELIPFLNQGADGIAAMQEKAKGLGLEISDNTAKSAHEFKDALKQVEDGTSGFGNMIVTWMLPALTGWAKEFATLFERGQAINLILRFVSEALRMVWIVVLNVVDAIQTFVKVIADAVAGLFVFFTALKEGGWKQAKAALAEIGNQIRTDVKDSFKNLSGEVEKSGKALDEHQKKMVKVALTAGQLKKAFDEVKKEFEAAHPGMASYFNEMDKLAKKTAGTLQDQLFGGITAVAGGIQKGLGTALSDLAMGTESLGTAITKMGDSILRSLVDYVAQLLAAKVAQAALGAAGEAILGASTAASVAAGATVATAWASAAALTSLASFGANAAPAQAGLVSTATLAQALGAHASGSDMIGQTGAYILHKDEGVVHPKANKKLTEFLDKNSGGNGSGGGPVTLEIHFSDRKMASYLLDLNRKGLIKLAVP